MGDQSSTTTSEPKPALPLSAPQAAELLRLGSDQAGAVPLQGGQRPRDSVPLSQAAFSPRTGATITLAVVGITGLLRMHPAESGRLPSNALLASGSASLTSQPRQEQTMVQGIRVALVAGVIGTAASGAQAQQVVGVTGWGAGLTNGGDTDFPNYGQLEMPADLGVVRQLVAGGYHNAALGFDGKVRCWGRNAEGQCNVPSTLESVVSIAAGHTAVHALRADGRIVSWGQNYSGELSPPPDLGVVDLVGSGYWHVLARQVDGVVKAWGYNESGQCNVPSGLIDVVQLTSGRLYSLALSRQGVVTGWGQIVVPTNLGQVRKIAAGNYHAAAIRTDGTVQCWGLNDRGQCEVPAWLHDAVDIGAGEYHTVALRTDGSAVCWGANTTVGGKPCGQALSPDDLHDAATVAVGGYHCLVLRSRTTAPTIAVFGGQECGVSSIPAGVSSAVRVTARDWHVGIVDPAGNATLWGRIPSNPDFGENNTTALGTCIAISAGGGHSAAVLTDGSVRSWGRNYAGECIVPGDLGPFPTVIAGYAHNLAVRADGSVSGWGWNVAGQASVPANAGECRQVAAG